MLTDKKITFDTFIRGLLTVLLVIGLLYLINRLTSVLLPFFIAWLIAYMIYPIVTFFQYKLKLKKRFLAILATMLLLLGILSLLFFLFVPPLIHEIIRIKSLALEYFSKDGQMNFIQQEISHFLEQYVDNNWLQDAVSTENIVMAVRSIIPKIGALLATSYSLVMMIFTVFITLLYLFFILLDYEQIARGWIGMLPFKYRPMAIRLSSDVIESMNQYFRGQALVALCVGIGFSIGFLLIDFPLAIGLGLFIGLLNLVPYLQIIGVIPTILLAILKASDTGQNFWYIFGLAMLVFAIVQILQDAFLVPKIMGKVTGFNPAIILLSLSIWGSLMGMIGMIIALPLTTLLNSYYQRYIHKNAPTQPSPRKQSPTETE